NQYPIEPKNGRSTAKNLSEADDCQILRLDNNLATSSPHALSARPEEIKRQGSRRGGRICPPSGAKVRRLPQRFNQLRAVHFTRGFASGNKNLQETIVMSNGQRGGSSQSSAFAVTDGAAGISWSLYCS